MKTKQRLWKFFFWWYYRLVPEFFHQWPPITSLKILVQNYEHDQLLKKNANEAFRSALKELDETRKELHNLRMQQIANPGTIDVLNKGFGTDYTNPIDN